MVKQTSRKTGDQKSESLFRGVRKRKWGKYVSEIRLPNSRERIWLGSYETAEKAARAFDAALFCLRGRGAKFNFPDNPPDIPGGLSLARSEIQAAAARFANEEPTTTVPLPSQVPPLDYSSTPSVSDSDLTMDWSFLEMLTMAGTGSSDSVSDLDVFGGLHDFTMDFSSIQNEEIDYTEEIDGASTLQHSFLWNF